MSDTPNADELIETLFSIPGEPPIDVTSVEEPAMQDGKKIHYHGDGEVPEPASKKVGEVVVVAIIATIGVVAMSLGLWAIVEIWGAIPR